MKTYIYVYICISFVKLVVDIRDVKSLCPESKQLDRGISGLYVRETRLLDAGWSLSLRVLAREAPALLKNYGWRFWTLYRRQ